MAYTSPYRADQKEQATALNGIAGSYTQTQNRGNSGLATLDPQYQNALASATANLQTDKFTDSYSAAKVADGTSGLMSAYSRAMANSASANARRGLGGGITAGTNASIENSRATALASARNNVAREAVDDRQHRALQLVQLLSSARSGYAQEEQAGRAGQASISGNLLDYYGNMAQQDEARKAQEAAQKRQAIIAAVSAGAQVFGGGAF